MTKPNFIYESDIELFQEKLLDWFSENCRDYPWRKVTATNYEIIIAEIFLQRTKADTVAKFLPVFLKQFPSWEKLGIATEIEIQTFIKPLGLFRQKGTRLFKLVQELKIRKGDFPKARNQVEEMPMMGQYLTNAYELYILKKRTPLLDVNMARILERFFGKRNLCDIRNDPYLQTLSYRIVNVSRSKELNWAILDYASLICVYGKPKCEMCIIKKRCQYFSNQSRT